MIRFILSVLCAAAAVWQFLAAPFSENRAPHYIFAAVLGIAAIVIFVSICMPSRKK